MVGARKKTITSLMTPVESSIEALHSILHPLGHNMIEYSMYGFSSQSIEVAFLQIQFKLFRFKLFLERHKNHLNPFLTNFSSSHTTFYILFIR